MAQSFDTHLTKVASRYLKSLNTKVAGSSLTEVLAQNPYYPSLLSLSDSFSRFNIDNNAFQVDREKLTDLEPPFVAFINLPGGKDFVLVTRIDKETVSYVSDTSRTVDKEEFLKDYRGIVWAAEAGPQSGQNNYTEARNKERINNVWKSIWSAALTLLAILVTGRAVWSAGVDALPLLALALIKWGGIAVSVLLLTYDIDKANAFVKNICSGGPKTNCHAVLGSRASKIFGISWGEIGFFYFASGMLWLLGPESTTLKFAGLAVANALAVPYIFFSLYYQSRVVKQWCPLCLAVQGLLAAELMWSIWCFWSRMQFSPVDAPAIAFLLFALALPITAWYGIKPLVKGHRDGEMYRTAYKRLQYNPDIFSGLLQQQAAAPQGWQHLGISIGDPAAPHSIIKVCNPFCGPCAKAHPVLENLVHSGKAQVRILFMVPGNEQNSRDTPAKHLLAIAAEDNKANTMKALNDWYGADKKDYAIFASRHPVTGSLDAQQDMMDAMKRWCEEAEITYTPTIFVNGRMLPENYTLDELGNIL